MLGLVSHSLWQPRKTFVSAVTVSNLSDTAPKSKFQRPLAAALPGPWGMNAPNVPLLQPKLPLAPRDCKGHGKSRSWCLVSPRGTVPHPSTRGCSQEGAQQLGGIRGTGDPALIPSPAPQPKPRVQPPQPNPPLPCPPDVINK